MDELHAYRLEKDEFFAHHPHSPLSREQKKAFKGLEYFPENPDLRFKLDLKPFPDQEIIHMQTSTGEVQDYQKYARIQFTVESEPVELTVFHNENGFFLPFVDALAGQETYPAGRYLEIEQLPDGKFLIDFNMAYNPFCAYSEFYSCPLTPFENRLKVPIRAGEKIFPH